MDKTVSPGMPQIIGHHYKVHLTSVHCLCAAI